MADTIRAAANQHRLEDLQEAGRLARKALPRSAQGDYLPSPRDPVAIIERQHESRLEHLIPLRIARMAQSPFAFFRGTAAIMAHDLRDQPNTGELVVASGDAHLANFGLFATPERRLTFELNDFDEVSTAPWEWDIKRLAVSIILAARERGATDLIAAAAAAVRAYQATMADLVAVTLLDRFYMRLNVRMLEDELSPEDVEFIDRTLLRARRRTSEYLLPRITTSDASGRLQILDDPPVLTHVTGLTVEAAQDLVRDYLRTARTDSAFLLKQFELVDVAYRIVGVGSVGTRCLILLFVGRAGEPIFLQIKEAGPSVLETFGGAPNLLRELKLQHGDHEGFRVITGQRILQTASDPFLGFLTHEDRDYYVRQFRDMKASIDLDDLDERTFNLYVRYCGMLLARGHGQSPAAPFISGYLGNGARFPRAMARWAMAYAAQVAHDFEALQAAIANGRLPITELV